MAGIVRPKGEEHYYYAPQVSAPRTSGTSVKVVTIAADRGSVTGRALMSKARTFIFTMCWPIPNTPMREASKVGGFRTHLGVPLLREGSPIGVIVLTRIRCNRSPTSRSNWLSTFADQAVIAIENVRLFDEVQKRTEDLGESLQQQTATADVLKVISRSTFDLKAVLDTLLKSAAHLCDAD